MSSALDLGPNDRPVDDTPSDVTLQGVSQMQVPFWFVLPFAMLLGCGAANDSTLFGKPSMGGAGAAGAIVVGAGGAPSAGGVNGSSDGGVGGLGEAGANVIETGGASTTDSGAPRGAGGAGVGGSVGAGGMIGTGGAPGGPWARCKSDSDCMDNRVCTASAQGLLAAGRPGACVHHCGLNTSMCDTPPAAGKVTCTQLLVDSFCTITCPNASPCPVDMECLSGICYYSN